MSQHQQTVVITGANRGIGFALVDQFLQGGWQVKATQRSDSGSRALAELTSRFPETLQIGQMDITRQDEITAFKNQIGSTLPIDLLINNAGVFPEHTATPFETMKATEFEAAFRVNFHGTLAVTKALLPQLRRAPEARIVMMSSGAASIGARSGRRYAYGASKAALNHLTRGLAEELLPERITVVAVSPGWVRTEMGGKEADLSPEEAAEALFKTFISLKPDATGQFLDRFGNTETYLW